MCEQILISQLRLLLVQMPSLSFSVLLAFCNVGVGLGCMLEDRV